MPDFVVEIEIKYLIIYFSGSLFRVYFVSVCNDTNCKKFGIMVWQAINCGRRRRLE
jgi:hypothetical protein